ncbi:MAG: flavin reductase [Gammaproteobacteria bacterium]|nr:flavin reductase [Gammaproteobacteria bacterium]
MNKCIDINCLFKVQYGLYIVSSTLDNKLNGQIATTVMQITNCPIKFSICLSKNTLTHEMISKSKVFAASVLSQNAPMAFIGKFGFKSGRELDKYKNTKFEQNITGCPLTLDYSLAVLEGKVSQTLDLNTHTIFVGDLLSAKRIATGTAMTYEYYYTVIKGKSPENAPTYVK